MGSRREWDWSTFRETSCGDYYETSRALVNHMVAKTFEPRHLGAPVTPPMSIPYIYVDSLLHPTPQRKLFPWRQVVLMNQLRYLSLTLLPMMQRHQLLQQRLQQCLVGSELGLGWRYLRAFPSPVHFRRAALSWIFCCFLDYYYYFNIPRAIIPVCGEARPPHQSRCDIKTVDDQHFWTSAHFFSESKRGSLVTIYFLFTCK